MNRLFPLLLFLCHSIVFGQLKRAHTLNYIVNLEAAEKGYADIRLDYIFPSKHHDSVTFILPSSWGEEQPLAYFELTGVNNYSFSMHDDLYHFNSDSSRITILSKESNIVSIKYKIYNGIKDSMPGDGEVYHPQITASYFSAFSNGLLLAVDDSIYNRTYTEIHFNLPKNWHIWSSGGKGKNVIWDFFWPATHMKMGVRPNSSVQNHIFLAGDFRVHQVRTETGQDLTFCIRGIWSFTDEEMISELVKTLDVQRNFWDDYSTRNFMVSLVPMISPDDQSMSYTGTGLQNAFAMSAYCNKHVNPESLRYLLNHELMHHWIGGKIANAADEELSYWFSEGFTDYFARKNMYTAGILSPQEYLETLDSVFLYHYSSPVATAHNDSIKVHFWDNRDYEKLPYNRGSIFALYLDNLIQKRTGGQVDLKQIMQEMLVDARKSKGNTQFNRTHFAEMIRVQTGIDVEPLISTYLIAGNPISIDTFNSVLETPIQIQPRRVFSTGFETEPVRNDKGDRIVSVTPGTGAVGKLEVGDIILGYDMYYNPEKEAKVLVRRNGEESWISFYPYAEVEVPQFIRR